MKVKEPIKIFFSTVTSKLGGGVNSHLDLVCTPVDYTAVSPSVYTNLLYPEPLQIDVLATQHTATRSRK